VFSRRSYDFFTLAVVAAAMVLGVVLLRRDFRIEYVAQYSGLDLPAHYQFAAFWAGQKGSFLIWLLFGALLGLPLARRAGRLEAPVMAIYTTTLLGLLFILVRENPFVMLAQAPLDGSGLNPLLQDDWMVIHPPVMFVGYASTAIPFAFAIAALWQRRYDDWARLAFPWALGGFLVLGTAILMGGYWAYKTLGWGGYWGWDPVENASLIPWLLGVVLIHGLYLERNKGRFRRANLVLASSGYLAVLYGTFLTRSGVLADFSVHSFVDLGISGWLIGLLGFFFGLAVWLLATRWRSIPSEPSEDPLLSRGSFLVLSTLTVTVLAVVVTIGTSAPLITSAPFLESYFPNPGQVGPSFYNRVNQPIAMLIAALLACVPYLTWKGEQGKALLRRLVPGAVAAVAMTAVGFFAGVREPIYVVFLFLSAMAVATNLHRAFAKFRAGGLRSAGGYLAHVGVGIILIGILASSAYDQSAKVTLEQGQALSVGERTMTFTRFLPRQGRTKERMEIHVVEANGKEWYSYPKLFVNDRTRQLMAQPSIESVPLRDLYISPIEFHPGEPAGGAQTLEIANGQAADFGDGTIRFAGFDLQATSNVDAAVAAGEPITVAARLEVVRDGSTATIAALYRIFPDGQVEAPPVALPGGGTASVVAINAGSGAIQLEVANLDPSRYPARPARLSVDITVKPLIALVWWGLYVVLGGGLLATLHRLHESKVLEALAARG
jgi:cytochrome c-type biogenesis protein CcmF